MVGSFGHLISGKPGGAQESETYPRETETCFKVW